MIKPGTRKESFCLIIIGNAQINPTAKPITIKNMLFLNVNFIFVKFSNLNLF